MQIYSKVLGGSASIPGKTSSSLRKLLQSKPRTSSERQQSEREEFHPIPRRLSSFLWLIFHSSLLLLGAAKKRDVRTINSSPCDLGPPSKTSTNGATGTPRSAARPITALRKSRQHVLFMITELSLRSFCNN